MAEPRRFVALDFETADHGRDSACSIGLVRVEDGAIVAREHYLIRPPRRDFVFTYLHGIAWEHVAGAPTWGELWSTVEKALRGADFIAAHNAAFDAGVLRACCDAAALPMPVQPFVCTMWLARRQWSVRPTRLPDVCRHLGIELNHHHALSDAEACARIVMAAALEDAKLPWRHATTDAVGAAKGAGSGQRSVQNGGVSGSAATPRTRVRILSE